MSSNRVVWIVALTLLIGVPALASSIWYVDGANGNDNNDCKTRQRACKTIGHAISLASPGDTIGIGPATYTENLTINISLKLIGSAASTAIIDGGGVNTVVTIPGNSVTLARLTIRNGHTDFGEGGGIYNHGSLVLKGCVVSGNSSDQAGGGIYNLGSLTISNSVISGNGGRGTAGILSYVATFLTIDKSTISGNTAGFGGGISATGKTTIRNSTISGNYGGGAFGGMYNGGTMTISSSTISGNKGGLNGGGFNNTGTVTISNSTISGNSTGISGGGIYSSGTVTLQDTIVANNTGGNCDGTMTSKGYNLSSDGTCSFSGPGDLNNTDPNLGPLQNNGGPTQTQGLLSGSPAIDAGNPTGCTDVNGRLLKTDQRGAPRPDKEDTGDCDMGAFERQSD